MTTVFFESPKELGRFEKNFTKNFQRKQKAALIYAGRLMCNHLWRKSAHIFDTGKFMTGWTATATYNVLTVWNKAKHAYRVEFGTPPGSKPPPTKAIAAWLARHGRDPSRAFGVAYSIGLRGIKGRPVMTKPSMLPQLRAILDKVLWTAWTDAINVSIK